LQGCYSTFNPAFSNPLIASAQTKLLASQATKQAQKLARYPSHKLPVISTFVPSRFLSAVVTLAATIEVTASPTEVPIWASVLKTPPANAWVRMGNNEVIAKFRNCIKDYRQFLLGIETVGREWR
jgi:hypothetical protein